MEAEISGWLTSYSLEENVRRAIESLAQPESLDQKEFESLVNFLFASGYHNELIAIFPNFFRRAPIVPWRQFLHILSEHNVKVDTETSAAILEGVQKQDRLKDVDSDPVCVSVLPKLEKHAKSRREKTKAELESRQSDLWDKLLFFRSQRMFDEENKTLEKLRIEFPNDPRIKGEQDKLQELRARDVLSKPRNIERLSKSARRIQLGPEESSALRAFFETAQKKAKAKPDLCEPIAVAFIFLDQSHLAVKILEERTPSFSSDWLFAEALFLAELHLQTLEQLELILKRYGGSGETTFAVQYLRAQCLWALGEKIKATELIKGIVHVRPLYRSAPALLQAWAGDLK